MTDIPQIIYHHKPPLDPKSNEFETPAPFYGPAIPPAVNITEPSRPMSITGLQEGAFQSKLAEMRKKVAASQANALTTIDGIVSEGIAKLEEAAQGAAKQAQREIDNALQEFAPMTNGGPV